MKINNKELHSKTLGHCHFCGDNVDLNKYNKSEPGGWQADHIFQKTRGGKDTIDNRLPICMACNRARWMYKGEDLRERITYGCIVKANIKTNKAFKDEMLKLEKAWEHKNKRRRKAARLGNKKEEKVIKHTVQDFLNIVTSEPLSKRSK